MHKDKYDNDPGSSAVPVGTTSSTSSSSSDSSSDSDSNRKKRKKSKNKKNKKKSKRRRREEEHDDDGKYSAMQRNAVSELALLAHFCNKYCLTPLLLLDAPNSSPLGTAGMTQFTPPDLLDGILDARRNRRDFSVRERTLLYQSIQVWKSRWFDTLQEACRHMELVNDWRTWDSVYNFLRNVRKRLNNNEMESWTLADILEDSQRREKNKNRRLLRDAKKKATIRKKQLHYGRGKYEGSQVSYFSCTSDSDCDSSDNETECSVVGPGEDMPFHGVAYDEHEERKTGFHALGDDWRTHRNIQHDLRQLITNQQRINNGVQDNHNKIHQHTLATSRNERFLQELADRVQRIEGHLNGDPPQPEEPYVPNGWEKIPKNGRN